MFGMDLLDTALEAGMVIYMVDAVTGKRKKVHVKNKAEADKLRAKNKALRAKLAKRKTTKRKTVKRKIVRGKSKNRKA